MEWLNYYQVPHSAFWQGRQDSPHGSCFYQIIRLLDLSVSLTTHSNKTPAFALLGFCCDEGVKRNFGRVGAASGPKALREVLAKLPIQRSNILIYDAGNISCEDGNLEEAQSALGEAVNILLTHNIIPILIGGGHEIAWGHYQGIAKAACNKNLGIINFDAHFDMRPMLADNKGSSGTPFLQIAHAQQAANVPFDYNCVGIQPAGNIALLFETMQRYQAHMLLAEDIHLNKADKYLLFLKDIIDRNQQLYITICLDVFAASDAPGVSAPQALGLSPWQIIPSIRLLAQSGKALSYDLAEFAPCYDIDNRTAKLAANFIYEIVHHHRP